MAYFDNSATTKIDEEVLKEVSKDLFTKVNEDQLDPYKKTIQSLLNTKKDIIFTSGSSESNNLALKGICLNSNKKEIITTHLEHSSINEVLKFLETKGFIIKYVNIKDNILDLNDFESLINKNTALITICHVNSETGMINDINSIGSIAHKHNIIFHSDITQSIGKIKVPLENVDLASISSHKIYGPKGIGVLLKNQDIKIKPLIYGDRTYNLGLIKGFVKALDKAIKNLDSNYKKTESLRTYLIDNIKSLPNTIINESSNNIPHILNFSVLNYKPETFLHYLEMNDIYISTKSACAKGDYSEAVYDLTNNMKRAETSVRISLSSNNNKKELDKLIDLIKRSKHGR